MSMNIKPQAYATTYKQGFWLSKDWYNTTKHPGYPGGPLLISISNNRMADLALVKMVLDLFQIKAPSILLLDYATLTNDSKTWTYRKRLHTDFCD